MAFLPFLDTFHNLTEPSAPGARIIYIMLIFDLDNNVPVLDNLTLAEFLTYYGQFDPTSG